MKPFYFAKRKHREGAPLSVKIKTRLALQLVPAATILVALAMSIAVSAQTITTFDAPGAGTGAFQGTFGGGLTPNGTIMGNYFDADNLSHGFLRDRNGAFTTFNAPGAGNVQGTYPFGINTNGAITGWYVDAT